MREGSPRRRRIGLLVPSTNSTAEPDFHRAVPPEVTVHSHRLWHGPPYDTAEAMDSLNSQLQDAARSLATAVIDVICMAGTANSFYRGSDGSRRMEMDMSRAAGVPAVASSPSVVHALRLYGCRRLSVATPYPEWDNLRLEEYLVGEGFQVLNVRGHPRYTQDRHPQHMNDQDPSEILEFVLSVLDDAAEAVFCPCSGWRAMEAAEELERRSGRLVVTTNMATIWRTLRTLGVERATGEFGRLLREMPALPASQPAGEA